MENKEVLEKRIKILQIASLVIVGAYFVMKYLVKSGPEIYQLLFASLFLVLIARSYFEYKLTGKKTRLFIFMVLFFMAVGISTYFYLNPQ
jgi:hypothetical protein